MAAGKACIKRLALWESICLAPRGEVARQRRDGEGNGSFRCILLDEKPIRRGRCGHRPDFHGICKKKGTDTEHTDSLFRLCT